MMIDSSFPVFMVNRIDAARNDDILHFGFRLATNGSNATSDQFEHGNFRITVEPHRVDRPADAPRYEHGVAFGGLHDTTVISFVLDRQHRRSPERYPHLAAMGMPRQNQVHVALEATVRRVWIMNEEDAAAVLWKAFYNLVDADVVFP